MAEPNRFAVIVSRVNNRTPYAKLLAHTVMLKPDGSLQVKGRNLGRSFSEGTWDQFVVETIDRVNPERD